METFELATIEKMDKVAIFTGGGVDPIIKAIAEEVRGLGVEFDLPMFSATQTNRGGYQNSDPDLGDTSESFGLPATADFMFALIPTEELEVMNQILIKSFDQI